MLPEQAIEISKVRFDHAKECLRDAKLPQCGKPRILCVFPRDARRSCA